MKRLIELIVNLYTQLVLDDDGTIVIEINKSTLYDLLNNGIMAGGAVILALDKELIVQISGGILMTWITYHSGANKSNESDSNTESNTDTATSSSQDSSETQSKSQSITNHKNRSDSDSNRDVTTETSGNRNTKPDESSNENEQVTLTRFNSKRKALRTRLQNSSVRQRVASLRTSDNTTSGDDNNTNTDGDDSLDGESDAVN